MTAFVLPQIPDAYCASAITADEFSLVWMDDHIVDCTEMIVVPLYAACSGIPDLDRAVFRGRYHPFSLAMKGHACDIVCVSLEGEDRAGVGGLDIVESDGMMTSGGEVSFVGRDTQAVYLGIRGRNRATAYA